MQQELTQKDAATVHDLLVILNLMYEDMHKFNVKTKSRDMAGRFLYSNGYIETVEKLDKSFLKNKK